MDASYFSCYVGLPFKDKGRDRHGLDCWGLLCLVYIEQTGIILPSYRDDYVTAQDYKALESLMQDSVGDWREISEREARPLDGVLMKRGGVECHVGVIVKRGYVLHVGAEFPFSRIESYRSMRLKRTISRFMRHEGLDDKVNATRF
jgi:cell wall-associated NlpC family hydrolase